MASITLQSALLLVAVFTINGVSASGKLPDSFKRCRLGTPEVNSCLRTAVEDGFKQMKGGFSQFGVFPLEPLQIPSMDIETGARSGPVTLMMHMKNLTVTGLGDSTILKYDENLKNYKTQCKTMTKEMKLSFRYTADGRILVLPLRGEGPGLIVMRDLETMHYLSGVPQKKKDGKIYWNVKDYRVDFKPRIMTVKFDGLFRTDQRIGDNLNSFINQNWELIFEEMKGSFEEAFGTVFLEITNRVFSKVPFDDVFLPPLTTDKKN